MEKPEKDPMKIVERILREDRKVLEKLNTGSSKSDKFMKKKIPSIRRGKYENF